MTKTRKRIGFLSLWGFGRGQAYLNLSYVKMITPEYDVFILKQGKNEILPEFKIKNVHVTETPDYHVDPSVFETWIKTYELDAVIFSEYKQWSDDGNDLIKIAKDCGAKVYGTLVWEKWAGKDKYLDYDRVFAQTVSFERFFRQNKFRKFSYIPFSLDLKEFTGKKKSNEKFVFFHPGGWGGVHNRKNTDVVIEAFKLLDDKDSKLVITSQKKLEYIDLPDNIEIIDENLNRNELIEKFYEADCTILPSKWETIGIPILESLAAGTPVITCNAPPMNEFIQEGLNGYLVNVDMKKYPDIGIYACDVSPLALKNKLINMKNKMLYPVLSRNSRYVAEKIYNIENNRKYLLKRLEKDLK